MSHAKADVATTQGLESGNFTHDRLNTPPASRAKANLCFAIYAGLREERSLRRVSEIAGKAGVKVSPKTLETYSRRDGWAERVRAFDAERAKAVEAVVLYDTKRQDIEDTRMTRLARQLLMAQLETAATAATQPDAKATLTGSEMARLMHEVFAIDRTIAGRVSTIRGTMLQLHDGLIREIVRLYEAALDAAHAVYAPHVNFSDPVRQEAQDAAAAIFGPGADQALQRHLIAAGLSDVVIADAEPEEEGD